MSKETLIIGAGAGLGKYLSDALNADTFVRGDPLPTIKSYGLIVYCAAKAHFRTTPKNLFQSISDNFLLLETIAKETKGKFVYISSVDVYTPAIKPAIEDQKSLKLNRESDDIFIEDLPGGYPSFKLMSEALVQEYTANPLILRPTSLFGVNMRPNNIFRLLNGDGSITLSAKSRFNCIRYQMISNLIEAAIDTNTSGIINCAATADVTLGELGKAIGYTGSFGTIDYTVPNVSNDRAASLVPEFGHSSLDILHRFWAEQTTTA